MDLVEWDCRRTFPPDATWDLLSRLETPYPLPFMLWLDLWCMAKRVAEKRGCKVRPIRFSRFVDVGTLGAEMDKRGIAPASRAGLWHIFSLLPAHVEWGGEGGSERTIDWMDVLDATRFLGKCLAREARALAFTERGGQAKSEELSLFAASVVPFIADGDDGYIVLDMRSKKVMYKPRSVRHLLPTLTLGTSFVNFMTTWSLLLSLMSDWSVAALAGCARGDREMCDWYAWVMVQLLTRDRERMMGMISVLVDTEELRRHWMWIRDWRNVGAPGLWCSDAAMVQDAIQALPPRWALEQYGEVSTKVTGRIFAFG